MLGPVLSSVHAYLLPAATSLHMHRVLSLHLTHGMTNSVMWRALGMFTAAAHVPPVSAEILHGHAQVKRYLEAAYEGILPARVRLSPGPGAPVQVSRKGWMVFDDVRDLQWHDITVSSTLKRTLVPMSKVRLTDTAHVGMINAMQVNKANPWQFSGRPSNLHHSRKSIHPYLWP